jgi:hypothetical protein
MDLKKFIEKYRGDNMAMLAKELDVDRATIKNWVDHFDIQVEHDRANIIRILKTTVLYHSMD